MKVLDLVKEKSSQKIFSITSMSLGSYGQIASLVEVNSDDTSEHLYPEKTPIIVQMIELKAFYELLDERA